MHPDTKTAPAVASHAAIGSHDAAAAGPSSIHIFDGPVPITRAVPGAAAAAIAPASPAPTTGPQKDKTPAPAAPPASTATRRRAPRSVLLRGLGIVGWDTLEPVVIAALAVEAPLLVIGPHGSAKTLLLARIADALQVVHRHYNASLLNFDDLIGFPVPENGRLVYLQTPATIWDAESVFFDEVSRCRPDLQNKLFPVVHERMVQGVPLEKLRFRWAAMNPPPREDEEDAAGEVVYAGAVPLDAALADRFAFIVSAPGLADLDASDQLAVLSEQGRQDADAAPRLVAAIAVTRQRLDDSDQQLRESAADYTRLLAEQLAKAGHPLSTRRAVQLARNIVAVHAALGAVAPAACIEDAFYLAARTSIPDAAWGRPIAAPKILAAHRAAWEIAKFTADAPIRRVLAELNPLKRIALAFDAELSPLETGQVLADSFAALPAPAQLPTAALLMPLVSERPDLPAGTIEPIAAAFARLARRASAPLTVAHADWRRKLAAEQLPAIDARTTRGRVVANAAVALLEANVPFDVPGLCAAYDAAQQAFAAAESRGRRPRRRTTSAEKRR